MQDANLDIGLQARHLQGDWVFFRPRLSQMYLLLEQRLYPLSVCKQLPKQLLQLQQTHLCLLEFWTCGKCKIMKTSEISCSSVTNPCSVAPFITP